MKPLTKLQQMQMMLVEAQNEVTKNEILERMTNRIEIKQSSAKNREMLGMIQSKMRHLRETMAMLEEFITDEMLKTPVDNSASQSEKDGIVAK